MCYPKFLLCPKVNTLQVEQNALVNKNNNLREYEQVITYPATYFGHRIVYFTSHLYGTKVFSKKVNRNLIRLRHVKAIESIQPVRRGVAPMVR